MGVGGSPSEDGRMVPKHIQRIDASVYRKMGGGHPLWSSGWESTLWYRRYQFMEQLSLCATTTEPLRACFSRLKVLIITRVAKPTQHNSRMPTTQDLAQPKIKKPIEYLLTSGIPFLLNCSLTLTKICLQERLIHSSPITWIITQNP